MKRWLCGVLAVIVLLTICAAFPVRVHADGMTCSEDFISILKKIEGFSQYPYWDNTQWTVGYGTRCPEEKRSYYTDNGITEEEALALLDTMLTDFESAVNSFAQTHSLELSQNQFDALVSFSYNCGAGWMSNADGYFNTAVREGKTGSEFIYGICLWSSADGYFILTKRRMSEANMYLNGVYEAYNDSADGTYPDTFKYVYLDGNGGKVRYIMHGYDSADSSAVVTDFVAVPTGTDASGNTFTYEFAGWYTASTGGTQVDVLDGSLADGTVLYAQWKDPSGQIVSLPKGDFREPLEVTAAGDLDIWSGPGSYYPLVTQLPAGTAVTITETYTYSGSLWGKCEHGWVSLNHTNYQQILDGQQVWPKSGVVNGNNVNVRNGAGTAYAMQYQLSIGDGVMIFEKIDAGGLSWGRLEDGNWICLTYVTFDEVNDKPDDNGGEGNSGIKGDVNGDKIVNKDDAIYLLRHVVYSDKYPVSVSGDVNGSGAVDKDDAIYLLRHVVYPDKYPLGNE